MSKAPTNRSPTSAMTRVAIAKQFGGKAMAWLEKDSDKQYEGKRT